MDDLFIVLVCFGTGAALFAGLAYSLHQHDKWTLRTKYQNVRDKYRMQLIQSTHDLVDHLTSLCEHNLIAIRSSTKHEKDAHLEALAVHTSYLIGQFLSRVWIVDQFSITYYGKVPDSVLKLTNADKAAIYKVIQAFDTNEHGESEQLFLLWRVEQRGIGQMMSESDPQFDGKSDTIKEWRCIDLMTFKQRWQSGGRTDADPSMRLSREAGETVNDSPNSSDRPPVSDKVFREAFRSIEDGLCQLSKFGNGSKGDERLRRVQHALGTLLEVMLEPMHIDSASEKRPAQGRVALP